MRKLSKWLLFVLNVHHLSSFLTCRTYTSIVFHNYLQSPISLKAVVPVFHPFLLEVVHIHLGLPYRLSSKYLIEWFRATYHGCFNFIVQTP